MTTGESSFAFQAEPSSEAIGFIITITVYQADESTPRPYAVVKVTNTNTNDSATKTANVNGIVTFILKDDLTEGYTTGDAIKVEQIIEHTAVEYYITGNGNATYPTWVQCTNATRTQLKINTTRFKINTIRNPGGISLNISQT